MNFLLLSSRGRPCQPTLLPPSLGGLPQPLKLIPKIYQKRAGKENKEGIPMDFIASRIGEEVSLFQSVKIKNSSAMEKSCSTLVIIIIPNRDTPDN